MAATCRYYGISRQCFYTWQRRYEEHGVAGLRDRSKRPHHSPNATTDEVIGKIIYLRQHYHFGPLKISMYLKRYHDVEISQSGVWRILKRLDMNRLPSSQRHKPPRATLETLREATARPPGPDRRQVHRTPHGRPQDATTSTPRSTTAPDCGCCGSTTATTRRPRSSSSTTSARSSRSGSTRSRPTTAPSSGSQFHWHVLDRGIRHVYIKPATPRLNGKVERSHRIDAEEFYRLLDGVSHRRRRRLQRQAPRMGGLLQLPPTPRSPRRPNPLRTTTAKTQTTGTRT